MQVLPTPDPTAQSAELEGLPPSIPCRPPFPPAPLQVLPVQWRKQLALEIDQLSPLLMPPGVRALREVRLSGWGVCWWVDAESRLCDTALQVVT